MKTVNDTIKEALKHIDRKRIENMRGTFEKIYKNLENQMNLYY